MIVRLTHIPVPSLPAPPSWFPGHMMKFTRMLPTLLTKTDVVLELRDSRLPLTSINRSLEGALQKWRTARGWDPNNPSSRIVNASPCERLVVLNKRDLVPEWGTQPFLKAMGNKFPGQQVFFASWQNAKDIRELSKTLVGIAKQYKHSMELNVLVIGMPNVGKSTLLNALRNIGIQGRTPKAFQTSAQPGLTRALSTRLKLSQEPLVYSFDTPGVMLPFLGNGPEGAERGVKLALIAGIKEGLYGIETLATYLLYRFNVLNPISPAYLRLMPEGSQPTTDLNECLTGIARRMGMVRRGAELDTLRAAQHLVRWWRDEGGRIAATTSLPVGTASSDLQEANSLITHGWGFDFQWQVPGDTVLNEAVIQEQMEKCIDEYLAAAERQDTGDDNLSNTQKKKQASAQEKAKRKAKQAKRRAA